MVNAIGHGVEDFELVHRPNETQDLRLEFPVRRLGGAGRERKQKGPAVRLPHQDHPFPRVGEIGEIGIVARILHIEIDLDVDQR